MVFTFIPLDVSLGVVMNMPGVIRKPKKMLTINSDSARLVKE